MTTVVAAIIERNGALLICQRSAEQAHPLKWEFPGGKVETGEALDAALERELQEELGVTARIGREITRYSYQYPGREPMLLVFFAAEIEGEPKNAVFAQTRWVRPVSLPSYDFLDGDTELIDVLANRSCYN